MKRVAVLGSTGSIGCQTLAITQAHPGELNVVALAAGSNKIDILCEQIHTFRPKIVCLPDAKAAEELLRQLGGQPKWLEVVTGAEGLVAIASDKEVDTVVTGLVGILGLRPTAAAVAAGKTVALANKETLVAAGSVIMPMCKQFNARIVPVDSEHSAIFQSLANHTNKDVDRIWLTGSGGPFRTWTKEEIDNATINDALRHPNWSMGRKITIDSATLMNKGLEVIEARWLFDIEPNRIKVVIHPQSILHSAVEFIDGSIVGQMGVPDMRLPIHYALFYPERQASTTVPRLDLTKLNNLTFEEPDLNRFPCLALAQSVAAEQNTMPCVLNAANEIAVEAFLRGQIRFSTIGNIIEHVLSRHTPVSNPCLSDILEANEWARNYCREQITVPTR